MTRVKQLCLLAIVAPIVFGPTMVIVMYLKLKGEGAYLMSNDEYMKLAIPIVQEVLAGGVLLTLGVWLALAAFGLLILLLKGD